MESVLPTLSTPQACDLARLAACDQRDARLCELTLASASITDQVRRAACYQQLRYGVGPDLELLRLMLGALEALTRDCEHLSALTAPTAQAS